MAGWIHRKYYSCGRSTRIHWVSVTQETLIVLSHQACYRNYSNKETSEVVITFSGNLLGDLSLGRSSSSWLISDDEEGGEREVQRRDADRPPPSPWTPTQRRPERSSWWAPQRRHPPWNLRPLLPVAGHRAAWRTCESSTSPRPPYARWPTASDPWIFFLSWYSLLWLPRLWYISCSGSGDNMGTLPAWGTCIEGSNVVEDKRCVLWSCRWRNVADVSASTARALALPYTLWHKEAKA